MSPELNVLAPQASLTCAELIAWDLDDMQLGRLRVQQQVGSDPGYYVAVFASISCRHGEILPSSHHQSARLIVTILTGQQINRNTAI